MSDTHNHRCQTCGMSFPCDGERYQNEDGFPEVACVHYHDQQWNQCGECLSKDRPHAEDDVTDGQ